MQADIAIVVVAFNRPASLSRLLNSLAIADYENYRQIQLFISIDYSGNNSCKEVAEQFEWNHGNKTILVQEKSLGLKKHVISCADLVENFDAIVVLEDDLYVAPFFYSYVQQAFAFFQQDERIAGVALYNNTFNEVAFCPFEAVQDGYDNYFMQVPCSWGQMWTKQQWTAFSSYVNEIKTESFDKLPETIQRWPGSTSWKKLFYHYLIENGKYFVYPRIALSTNFGDPGQHLTESQPAFQSSLLLARQMFRFQSLDGSWSIYDGFYELEGKVYNRIFQKNASISFDLNGTKPLQTINTTYLLSSKICTNPLRKFPVACYPYENNILLNLEEKCMAKNHYSLGETRYFSEEKQFERLPVDVKRVFLSDGFIRQAVLEELVRMDEYRIGHAVMKPYRFFKKIMQKVRR